MIFFPCGCNSCKMLLYIAVHGAAASWCFTSAILEADTKFRSSNDCKAVWKRQTHACVCVWVCVCFFFMPHSPKPRPDSFSVTLSREIKSSRQSREGRVADGKLFNSFPSPPDKTWLCRRSGCRLGHTFHHKDRRSPHMFLFPLVQPPPATWCSSHQGAAGEETYRSYRAWSRDLRGIFRAESCDSGGKRGARFFPWMRNETVVFSLAGDAHREARAPRSRSPEATG